MASWRKETVLSKPKVRRVVIAMDGSHHSEEAFEWFLHNFRKENDYVVIVHGFEAKSMSCLGKQPDTDTITEALAKEAKNCESLIQSYQEKLKDKGLQGEVMNVPGKPGEVVVRVAHDINADVIICGTRGHGKLRRTLMGSVSHYIIDHSDIPVVVCRHRQRMQMYNLWGQGTGKVSGDLQIS